MGTETHETGSPAMHVVATAEHKWLQQLVGEWTYLSEAREPGKDPVKAAGTERVRSLGDVWVVGEGEGEMPGGGRGRSIVTLGYDPARKRFVGTWVGSMMANMWVYDGWLDASRNVLTLESEGPSMSGEGTAKY